MTGREKDRAFLREEIAAARLKLATMDFEDAASEAAPYVIRGEMIPEELRFRVQDTLKKLDLAKEEREIAEKAWREAMG